MNQREIIEMTHKSDPVAWMHPANASCVTTDPTAYARGIPLYTAPQAQTPDALKPVAFIDRAHLKELKNTNGTRVWAEGPNMYFPSNDCEVPTHLVAVYADAPQAQPATPERLTETHNRKAFEDFVKSEMGDIAVMDAGRYISPKIQNYWRVWEAASSKQ